MLDSSALGLLDALRTRAWAQRDSDWHDRKEKLRALRRAFISRRSDLKRAIYTDFGRPPTETDLIEYLPTLGELDGAIANVKHWSRPTRLSTPLSLTGATSEVIPEPKGLCLIISPWNYPVNLALSPLISCIAAGNTALLKPSEFTPATCGFLRDLIGSVFRDNEVGILEGGPEVSQALLEQPFDHIFFTGSPQIGRVVMAAAAKGPTSVTLELGGKSPALVQSSANIADTARKLVWAKFVNAGQTCIAPDYILVESDIAASFKEALCRRIRQVYPSETKAGRRGSDYTQIITKRHASRLLDLIADARDRGAKVLLGGTGDIDDRYISPTVLDQISPDMKISKEEIFGPVLPVIEVGNLDEAIAHVNAAPPPLSSYIFTRDKKASKQFFTQAPAGGSCVNHALVHFGNEKLPFGGIGPSGIGRSHGQAGFNAFSNMRSVMRDRFSPTHFFFPPYTSKKKTMMNAFMRFMSGFS